MTEFVEGPIHGIQTWADGKGVDIKLHQDDVTYYYVGDGEELKKLGGRPCRFEVKQGEGEHANKKEILNFVKLRENPVHVSQDPSREPNQNPTPLPQMQPKMIQMPLGDFQRIIQQKAALAESKIRALDAAVRAYAAMGKIEKDYKAAADEIVRIARIFETFFA